MVRWLEFRALESGDAAIASNTNTWLRRFVVALALVLAPSLAFAGQVTLAWDANTEPDLGGYKVYYGNAGGTYTANIDVGNVTTYSVTGLQDGLLYFFAVTAYGTTTSESG